MSASDWKGYLLRAKNGDTYTKFPMKYINEASWETTPNQREEIKAYRDENSRDLHRVTAAGKKTSISFRTRPNLHLRDKIAIQKFFTDNEQSSSSASENAKRKSQRRITLQYWNDESNEYKTSDFYRTDIKFTIKKVTDDDIIYEEIQIELVEY